MTGTVSGALARARRTPFITVRTRDRQDDRLRVRVVSYNCSCGKSLEVREGKLVRLIVLAGLAGGAALAVLAVPQFALADGHHDNADRDKKAFFDSRTTPAAACQHAARCASAVTGSSGPANGMTLPTAPTSPGGKTRRGCRAPRRARMATGVTRPARS